jgi:Domain of unknown function (DUF4145)
MSCFAGPRGCRMTTTPPNTVQEMPFPWELLLETSVFLWKDWPKDMIATGHDNSTRFSLNGECPHCRRFAVFTQVGSPVTDGMEGLSFRIVCIMKCPGCFGYILAFATHLPNGFEYEYEKHYPLGMPDERLDKSIPKDVAEDFQEAIRCQWAKSYRACVVMCRRALQTSVLALKAQGDTLVKQIDSLAANGVITTPLKEFAHEIRLTGNAGAHSDWLQDIKESDAESIMEFTREYLDHVYIMPAKLQERRAKTQPQPKNP